MVLESIITVLQNIYVGFPMRVKGVTLTHSLGTSSKKRQRIRVDGDASAKQSSVTSLLVVFTLEFTLVITGATGKKNNANRSHQYMHK